MRVRMTLAGLLAAACLLAWLNEADAGGKRKRAKPANEVVSVTYSVADLVVPIDYAGTGAAPKETLEDKLIELIRTTVAPRTWSEAGGSGTIQYFPLGMALVVKQTPAEQEEVKHLLDALRRLQDVQVAVELRIVSLSEAAAERLRDDLTFEPVAQKDGSKVRAAQLSDKELAKVIEQLQADKETSILQAPRLTLINGQTGRMMTMTRQAFVTDYRPVNDKGRPTLLPVIEEVETGLSSELTAVVSADRKDVRLGLNVKHSSLALNVPSTPVTVTVEKEGEPARVLRSTVQQPQVDTLTAKGVFSMPDGRTTVVSLGRLLAETRVESKVPVLGDLPYVSRLFRNVGYGREARELLVFVTPRVIVSEEAEDPTPPAVVPAPPR